MFSKSCEYGIRAAIYIATQSLQDKRVSLVEIAEEIDSPKPFTAKILQQLAKAQIITSIKGKTGGYEIDKAKMKDITLSQIVACIDGEDIYNMCGLGLRHCSASHPCPLHNQFKIVRDNLKQTLQTTNLASLAVSIEGGLSYLKS